MMTHDQFVDAVIAAATAWHERSCQGPGEEAPPVLFMVRPDSHHAGDPNKLLTVPIPDPGVFMAAKQHNMRHAVGPMVEMLGVLLVAFGTEAWMSVVPEQDAEAIAAVRDGYHPESMPMPSQDPDRVEVMNLSIHSPQGTSFASANIHRPRGLPPVLGSWERFDPVPLDSAQPTGEMSEPLRDAIRHNLERAGE